MPIPATIRGHQASFRIFKNGVEQVFDAITRVSVSEESSLERKAYVGRPTTESDKSHMGWSGSFEMEARNKLIEDFMDALITDTLNGIGVTDYSFTITEIYGDGSRAAHVYTNCLFKYGREQTGLDNKVTKSIEFIASQRVRVA